LGIKVILLSHKKPSLASIVFKNEAIQSLKKYGKWLLYGYRSLCAAYLVAKVAYLIKAEGIELVHHNDNLYQDRFTVAAAHLAGVPQVCRMRSFSQITGFEQKFIASTNPFICVSKAVRDFYLECGVPIEKIRAIYNGFNSTVYEQIRECEVSILRAEFGVSSQDILVSNIGRLDF